MKSKKEREKEGSLKTKHRKSKKQRETQEAPEVEH